MAFTARIADLIADDKTGLLAKHESWERVCLSEVAGVLNGAPFDSAKFSTTAGTPLARIRDVRSGETTTYYTGEYDDAYVLAQGDLLVGMDGDFNTGYWGSQRAVLNQRVCKLSPNTALYDKRFLGYVLPGYLAAINANTPSITVKHLSSRTVGEIELPLPPRAEQSRIAEKLDELLSDLDAGVAELKAAQRKLAQYRQSLLKAAVDGTLTADWRAAHGAPQETGSELLQRILTERRARWEQKQLAKFAEQGKTPPKDWQSKYPVPVAPDLVDLPELPKGWTWATVDQCTIDDGGITDGPFGSNLKSEHYTEAGPRVIRLQNIGDGRFLDARAHISEDRYESLKKHAVIEGDVVVAMLGEVLPRACAIPKGVVPAIVKADCARVRLNQDLVFSDFVVTALNAEPIRKRVNTLVKGIGRPRINLGTVRSIALPLPPKAEQYRILEVLSESLESCSSQSLAIENGVALSSAQRKNILKAAFSGNLVPQDPNDEPASELLTRIRAEREKQAKLPRALQTKQRKEISAVARQLMDVLTEAGDWMSAQEAFRRCGIGDGAKTDQIEAIYTQMRALDKASRLAVEPVNDVHGRKLYDILKLTAG